MKNVSLHSYSGKTLLIHSTLYNGPFIIPSFHQIASVLVAIAGSSYPYSDYPNASPDYSFAYDILWVNLIETIKRQSPILLSYYCHRDTYTGQDFGHQEARKQEAVTGQYHVLLPDDRLQTVRYTADQNGYIADVQYSDGSSSPAYGKAAQAAAAGYSGGYSGGGATVKVSSYFNPSTARGYGYGGSSANSQGGYNNYQSGQGSYLQGNQAFKSGCVCQCPS